MSGAQAPTESSLKALEGANGVWASAGAPQHPQDSPPQLLGHPFPSLLRYPDSLCNIDKLSDGGFTTGAIHLSLEKSWYGQQLRPNDLLEVKCYSEGFTQVGWSDIITGTLLCRSCRWSSQAAQRSPIEVSLKSTGLIIFWSSISWKTYIWTEHCCLTSAI